MGLIDILDAYILHQIEVITARSQFDLNKAKNRQHIVEGLIKAISCLDEVVKIIRSSKDKSNAKNNLIQQFEFTEKQAEAIVMLQLYRLTNTDIEALKLEHQQLSELINELNEILDNPKKLKKVIIKELNETKKKYKVPRLTTIKDEIEDIVIDKEAMIIPEDVYITITRDGYIKRISPRSYKASEKSVFGKKDDDILLNTFKANTINKLLVFTNKGNYLYIPINELEEFKWKDVGKHISYLVKLDNNEKIIKTILVTDFKIPYFIAIVTKNGQIKRTALKDFEVTRYTKAMKCMGLKDGDEVVDVDFNSWTRWGGFSQQKRKCFNV